MAEVILTKENFSQVVLESKIPVLVDFWASWCGPCRVMKPIVEELASRVDSEKFKVALCNVDEATEIAEKYNIMGVPSFLFFKAGQVVDTLVGMQSQEELKSRLEKLA